MNILITGAGRGLGLQLAARAAESGHTVIACARDTADGSNGLSDLAARYPGRVRLERLNVASEVDADSLASKLRSEGVGLNAIVNNAGILLGREHRIGTLPLEDAAKSFEVNVIGPMNVVKHLSPLLRDHAGAIVANVSSEAGSFSGAYGGDYAYGISKAALNFFSKQLREELRERGIRVLAVHPGWIRTDMGGEAAPMSASESAEGILGLLDGRTAVGEDVFFVDHRGAAMPL